MRQERTPAWLAHKINCERTNIYHIFARSSINTDQLMLISRTLGRDFFRLYSSQLDEKESGVNKTDGSV